MTFCGQTQAVLLVCTFCLHLSQTHECPVGYYGTECDKACGHCLGGHTHCDVFDGVCVNGCSRGYMGLTCHLASPGKMEDEGGAQTCNRPVCDRHPVSGDPGHKKARRGGSTRRTTSVSARLIDLALVIITIISRGMMSGCVNQLAPSRHIQPSDWEINMAAKVAMSADTLGDGKQTRMICQDLQASFHDIINVVNSTYPIHWWPLLVLILGAVLALIVTRRRHQDKMAVIEAYKRTWQSEFLRQPGQGDNAAQQSHQSKHKNIKTSGRSVASDQTM